MNVKSLKSLYLEDNIFCRIEEKLNKKRNVDKTKIETWIMSHLYRYVKNPKKRQNPLQKFIGKIKLKKLRKGKYEDEYVVWNPVDSPKYPEPDEIEITIYNDDDMTDERNFDLEEDQPPWWLGFQSKNPQHNKIKPCFPEMFDYLKDQKWIQRAHNDRNMNQFEEKSEFVIDCNQLLGIGGEGIVVRRADISGPNNGEKTFLALKIISLKDSSPDSAKLMRDKMINLRQKQTGDTKVEDKTGVNNIIQYQNIEMTSITNFGSKIPVLIIGRAHINSLTTGFFFQPDS